MQLQQLLQPLQSGTFRFARTFLNDNPDLLQKYVSVGMDTVGVLLVPLIAKWDDETLDSFKRVIDKHIPKKSGDKFNGSFRRAVDPKVG